MSVYHRAKLKTSSKNHTPHEPNPQVDLTISSNYTLLLHSPSLVLQSSAKKNDTLRLFGWSGECQPFLEVQLALDPVLRRTWNRRRETFDNSVSQKTNVLPWSRKVEWELLELRYKLVKSTKLNGVHATNIRHTFLGFATLHAAKRVSGHMILESLKGSPVSAHVEMAAQNL